MPPFRLTAQQYQLMWSDRIESDRAALEAATNQRRLEQEAREGRLKVAADKAAALQAQLDAAAAAAAAAADEDDVRSEVSHVSSRVSGISATSGNLVQRLETKLERERSKREELEKALVRARAPPLIG